ncbi:MAG TPA: replication factor C large subunit [Methanotrichaceae archaeon]|nr:replication factor C large subunit [Methanotrichaceae archaeon]
MVLVKWTEKYRPSSLEDILGNNKAVTELRSWAQSWEKGIPVTRAAILYGPAGTGKTSAAIALAEEFDWDYIEMNASDIRTASMIEKITGPASRQSTFSGRRRLIVLDEADNLHGTADRGGAAAMLKLVRQTGQPVLLIANEYYEMDKQLRDAAKGIQFRSLRATTVASAMRSICNAEGISCEPEALEKIAELAGGDMRSAVNDLQAAALGETELRAEDVATAERDVKSSIFKVLEIIFKGSDVKAAQEASYTLDESPEDLIHWIDENLPLVYEGEDLERGFDVLSRSDVFLGRVRNRQNYGLWRYASFLMTGGVQAAKSRRRSGYVAFRPPGIWRRMGQSRRARNIRDSAASKIAKRLHVGLGYARSELMDFIGLLLKSKKLAPKVAAELNLSPDEIALLIGSTTSTKKVQSIFDDAQKIREAEEIEDIELGWQRPDQQIPDLLRPVLYSPVLHSPDKEKTDQQKPDLQKNDPQESDLQKPDQQIPVKQKPLQKRSVQKKHDQKRSAQIKEDPALEVATEPKDDGVQPDQDDQAAKRQKSLFDF